MKPQSQPGRYQAQSGSPLHFSCELELNVHRVPTSQVSNAMYLLKTNGTKQERKRKISSSNTINVILSFMKKKDDLNCVCVCVFDIHVCVHLCIYVWNAYIE